MIDIRPMHVMNYTRLLILFTILLLVATALTHAESTKTAPRTPLVSHTAKKPTALPPVTEADIKRGKTFRKVFQGDPQRKRIALTFDDGPYAQYTPKLLAVLREHDVKATFFVIGARVEENPDLLKAEIADGHSIGNHTYHHYRMRTIDKKDALRDVTEGGRAIKAVLGRTPRLFRSPGGGVDRQMINAACALGYTTVMWSGNVGDYRHPMPQVIVNRTIHAVRNGAILLFHDGVQETIDALPAIIKTLKAKGYQFVTVDELLGYTDHADRLATKQVEPTRK